MNEKSVPYKATKMWKELIDTFHHTVPTRRHWKHMKAYDNCFSGIEAITYFHKALQVNPHINKTVTRAQTLQLLNRFLKAGIFCEVVPSHKLSVDSVKEGSIYMFPKNNSVSPNVLQLANYRYKKSNKDKLTKEYARKKLKVGKENIDPLLMREATEYHNTKQSNLQDHGHTSMSTIQVSQSRPIQETFHHYENINVYQGTEGRSSHKKHMSPQNEEMCMSRGSQNSQQLIRKQSDSSGILQSKHELKLLQRKSEMFLIDDTRCENKPRSENNSFSLSEAYTYCEQKPFQKLGVSQERYDQKLAFRQNEDLSRVGVTGPSKYTSRAKLEQNTFTRPNELTLGLSQGSYIQSHNNSELVIEKPQTWQEPKPIPEIIKHLSEMPQETYEHKPIHTTEPVRNQELTSESSHMRKEKKIALGTSQASCEQKLIGKQASFVHPYGIFPMIAGNNNDDLNDDELAGFVVKRLSYLLQGLDIDVLLDGLQMQWISINILGGQNIESDVNIPFVLYSLLTKPIQNIVNFPFEDVQFVLNYFKNIKKPLTTYELFDCLIESFLYIENTHQLSASTENLLLEVTSLNVYDITDKRDNLGSIKSLNAILPPNYCFETAFFSDIPITRIIPRLSTEGRDMNSVEISKQKYRTLQNFSNPKMTDSSENCNSQAFLNKCEPSRVIGSSDSMRLQSKLKTSSLNNTLLKQTQQQFLANQEIYSFVEPTRSCSNPDFSLSSDAHSNVFKEEIDINFALEFINKLVKHSKETTKTVGSQTKKNYLSTDVISSDTDSSESESESSYHTACSSVNNSQDYLENDAQLGFRDQMSKEGQDLAVEVLHLWLLFIPPANRYQLNLLLKYLSRLVSHEDLKNQVIKMFSRVIMNTKNNWECYEEVVHKIVNLMMLHCEEIFPYPQTTANRIQKSIPKENIPKAVTYCEMVTHKEFEKQKLSSSQSALVELLEQILTDQRMPRKEKMERLKLFKQSYPDIYARRFPEAMASENLKEKSSRRRMGTFRLKFKNLRL